MQSIDSMFLLSNSKKSNKEEKDFLRDIYKESKEDESIIMDINEYRM